MKGVRILANRSRRELVLETLQSLSGVSCRCPSHSPGHISPLSLSQSPQQRRVSSETDPLSTDYAYEISSCSVRIGKGVTREVGKDFVNRGVQRVLLLTDKNLMQHLPFSAVQESLRSEGIEYDVFSEVS